MHLSYLFRPTYIVIINQEHIYRVVQVHTESIAVTGERL